MTLKQACFPKEAPCAFKDLMIHEFCNSHYVSHFAAFFIVVGAKISIAESCFRLCVFSGGARVLTAGLHEKSVFSGVV
jgi:hypothetical protein